jgi:hypothetical protein
MARSPIEMMIDKACGYDPSKRPSPRPPAVILRCPSCAKEKGTWKHKSDPVGTAVVQSRCPECCGGDFDTPIYFDHAGKEIPFPDPSI